MLKVSDNFKKKCNSDKLKYREFIIIDNKEIDIKGNLSATAYKDTTFFGKFNLKMLTFETENDIDYKGKEFVYYKEVDGESAKIGTFIVTEVKDSDTFENVNVTAYDYGLNFANPYKSTLDYKSNKITMLQVAQEICTNCGVELENTSLPNGNFIVDSNQFINGEQFGDVVCLIALENGMFATINENDKLEFIFKKTTEGMIARLSTEDSKNLLTEDDNYIVVSDLDTIDDYVDLNDKRDTKHITCVLVATSKDLEEAGAIRKDQELIKKYGENWLKVYDYAFAYSSEKCEQLVDAIFNQVKGFGYSSFETNYSFKPYLQLGDEIKFRNKKGDLVKSIILRIESNYDEIKLSAPSIINASVEYDLPQSTEELVKEAMISVNKANAEIVLKVDSNGKISQVRLDGDADSGSIIEINADQVDLNANDILNLIAGNTINLTSKNITINSNNFSVDSNGNMSCNNATANGLNINNGNINLTSISENAKFTLNDYENASCKFEQSARSIKWYGLNNGFITMWNTGTTPIITLSDNNKGLHTNLNAWYIETPELRQTSLEKSKKNFEKFDGALNIINDIDLYKYNLKQEEDDHKKHIGFVIGDKYNYSSEITSIDEEGNETGVDLYSMTSLCLQAIKEQQEKIELLEKQLNDIINIIKESE